MPVFWSAGGGVGWPVPDVLAMLAEKFGLFDHRLGSIWDGQCPLPICHGGLDPIIITCDPQKADLALLLGAEVAFLPLLMPPAIEPPAGYSERYGSCGDPWLRDIQ